jgi:hypothetical protein
VQVIGNGLSVRVTVVALAASLFLTYASSSHAGAFVTPVNTPNSTSPVVVAAKYVKSVDPSMKMSTNQLARLITDLRAREKNAGRAYPRQSQATSGNTLVTPNVSYWNHTYWFGHWDVAMMAGLSAVAIVAILLTTGPISVAVAWGLVGAIMGVITTAFFSGYCAYYVTTQHRGGVYHC